jgi:phosphoadenosine phosphosulfate reductase
VNGQLIPEQLLAEDDLYLDGLAPLSIGEMTQRAIDLLREHAPKGHPYYLAFSGGKDSIVAKKLCELAGVQFEAFYNSTTIDPPELVRFIKQHHADVKWNLPKHGNMMTRIINKPAAPPTRAMRWCCEEYKEHGGDGRVKVMGVRKAESAARARRWHEVSKDGDGNPVICPIVFWSDVAVWSFIDDHDLPYCSLYNEGWKRLGCVGCPLSNEGRLREFERYPAFERNWKKAVIGNWQKWKDVQTRAGKPRFQSRFKTGESFWRWWMQEQAPDVFREDCQTGLLWTNQGGEL